MLDKLFTGAAAGWWGRRLLEWLGLGGSAIGGLFTLYNNMPPQLRGVLDRVLAGNWEEVTLGAAVPFAIYVVTQVLSFRATTKPQIVTDDGKKVSTNELPHATKSLVEAQAETVVARKKREPSLLERMFGKPRQ